MARWLAPVLATAALAGAAPAAAKVGDLYAIRYGAHGNLLVPYDAAQLVGSGPAIPIGHFGHAWSVGRDRSQLVSAAGWRETRGQEEALAFVDLHSGRIVGTVSLPGERRRVTATAWANGRVLAVVSGEPTTVYAIDPVRRAVVAKAELDGTVALGERTPGGLVLLLETPDRIGPASLAVVDNRLRVRTVTLDRITVGTVVTGSGRDRLGTMHRPGLAVANNGRHAFVFSGPPEPAAAIDLRTLSVRYAPVRLVSAATKGRGTGWTRTAAALPDGRVVVSGSEFRAESADVRVVDPRNWSSTLLDAGSSWFRVGGGLVFTYGPTGTGLRIWRPSGLSDELFAGSTVAGVHVVGPRALVLLHGVRAAVIDLGTGRVVRKSVPAHPLLGAGERIG
jgi:hypothetical protein